MDFHAGFNGHPVQYQKTAQNLQLQFEGDLKQENEKKQGVGQFGFREVAIALRINVFHDPAKSEPYIAGKVDIDQRRGVPVRAIIQLTCNNNANNLDVQEVYQKLLSQLPFMKGEMAPDQLMRNMLVDVDSHYLKQGSLKVLKSMMMSSFRNPLQNREQFNAMVKTDQLDDHSLRQLLSTVEKKMMAAPEEILQLIGRSLSALRFISSRSREIFLLFFFRNA